MNFIEYQLKARKTAIYPSRFIVVYPALGLAGETGETCEKVKKIIRDVDADFSDLKFVNKIKKELGDVLWYIANLAADLNIDLDDIAQLNIKKLESRKYRGKLKGTGDNR